MHYHEERPHQGKGNVMLFPSAQAEPGSEGTIEYRERLGGLLKYYHRKAATDTGFWLEATDTTIGYMAQQAKKRGRQSVCPQGAGTRAAFA
jgi:hypothetical protein